MRVLLTGADGQVGREFPDVIRPMEQEIQLIGIGREKLDITQKDNVERVVNDEKPSIVINAAAYTTVDKAEQEPEKAFAVNRDGAANLAEACAKIDIPLIQISTDYVFDGNKAGAYIETDDVNPMSVYGKSKLEGEQKIRTICEKHIILRTSWVFGPYGKNFVYTIIRLAKQKPELSVVNDQFGCPTSAFSIAKAILQICRLINEGRNNAWGIYHYCGSPGTNWYEFSKTIVKNIKQKQELMLETVNPVSSSEYPTAAVRPMNSVMNCDKIRKQFGINQQAWVEGLQDMLVHPHFLAQST